MNDENVKSAREFYHLLYDLDPEEAIPLMEARDKLIEEAALRKARLAQAETLERERCEIARIAVAIKKALQSYEWLIEGRGSYEWDDDRWHDEFKHACHNIRLELEPLEKIGADLSNRTAAAGTSSVSAGRTTGDDGQGICQGDEPPATQTKEEDCSPYGKPSSGPGRSGT